MYVTVWRTEAREGSTSSAQGLTSLFFTNRTLEQSPLPLTEHLISFSWTNPV